MNIGKYIKSYMSCKNITVNQLASKLNMESSELEQKLENDTLTAKELVAIGALLYMDLEQMSLELKYDNIECEYYVYAPIEVVSYEELLSREQIDVRKFRVCKVNDINEEDSLIPVFEPTIDSEGEESLVLKMRQANTMVKVKKELHNGMPIAYYRIKKVGNDFKLEEKYYVPNKMLKNKEIEIKSIKI